jgi:hypothetical protein
MLEAQIEFLKRLPKVTEEELDRFTVGEELPSNVAKVRPETDCGVQFRNPRLCILDYVSERRVVGRNYVARCPSCAHTGHDRSRDNLAEILAQKRAAQRSHSRNHRAPNGSLLITKESQP